MDFIKEAHDLLNHHLGSEHRGSKKLGPEHDELKKDVQALVLHALKIGKMIGSDLMKLEVDENYKSVSDVLEIKYSELCEDVNVDRYKSKTALSNK